MIIIGAQPLYGWINRVTKDKANASIQSMKFARTEQVS